MVSANFASRTMLAVVGSLAVLAWSAEAQAWTERVVHSFAGGNDGSFPESRLVIDQIGNVFGTTSSGGGGKCNNGCGTVFKIASDGTETVLYAFHSRTDGASPVAGLIIEGKGNLFGTTSYGGSPCACGTVFEVTPTGTHTVIYDFRKERGGEIPTAALLADTTNDSPPVDFQGDYVLIVREDWGDFEYANPAAVRPFLETGRAIKVEGVAGQKIRVELK